MRILIRYFFRLVRLILTPFMLIMEKLTTPKGIERTEAAQAEVDEACKALSLYQFKTCPFCIKVRKEMARLNLPIELRDAQHNEQHRATLAEQGGRVKVPCLRIADNNEADRWMYESDDIIAYLRERFEQA
ncbi:glutaredoxin [Idiomarina fontislapidosi]|uniref:Glutaredoxin n=1 Tax=Idiomarina fontislapidosi TaxID=263723 RepID=A0A432YBS5_9GAMM|nr:glutathione S-transferase N-terminal domain-containing protein [Idiomarina fontislapidosi]PYE35572.1 glutaredoxin [Idiomarina fontislapidosi]RUO58445.1 glutaredoxin [Idiomarina fontislapidosi]